MCQKNTDYKTFIISILKKTLNVHEMFIGNNHRFGKNGEGDARALKELNLNVIIPPMQKILEKNISSTLIRDYIKKGKIKKIKSLLGYPFLITPITKNERITVSHEKILPPCGRYKCLSDENKEAIIKIDDRTITPLSGIIGKRMEFLEKIEN